MPAVPSTIQGPRVSFIQFSLPNGNLTGKAAHPLLGRQAQGGAASTLGLGRWLGEEPDQSPLSWGCSLFTLGDLLYAVGLCLGRAAHCGDELLVCAQDLLRLHCDLLLALYNLDLDLFLPDLLLLTGPLQLIGQLGLGCL